jgi:NAD(P)H dehydrogenase (quinone)
MAGYRWSPALTSRDAWRRSWWRPRAAAATTSPVPRSLDLATVAASAARQWGTPLEYPGITPSEHCAEMAIAVEDPWWIYAYSTTFASIRGQRWAAASDEVHRLTGCSPTLLLPLEDETAV